MHSKNYRKKVSLISALERKKKKKTIFRYLIYVLAIIYTISFIIWLIDRNLEIDTLKQGTIINKHSVTAVILNDSYVIKNKDIENIIYLYDDGQRVNKDTELMYVFDSTSADIYQSILSIEDEIFYQKKLITDQYLITGNDINDLVLEKENILKKTYLNNTTISEIGVLDLKIKDINKAIVDKKYSLIEVNNDVTQLEMKKDQLHEMLISKKGIIYSPTSGIFSSSVDGYESISIRDLLSVIDADWINSVIQNPRSEKYSTDSIGKLLISDDYYFAMVIDVNAADSLKDNDYIKIKFNEIQEPYYAIKHKIIKEDDDRYILILRTNRYQELLSNRRTIDLDMIISTVSGIKIPIGSVFDIDEENKTAYIFVSNSGNISKKKIDILSEDQRYMIIYSEELEVSDLLVSNPEKAKEGMFIK